MTCVFGHKRDEAQVGGINKCKPARTWCSADISVKQARKSSSGERMELEDPSL